MDRPIWIQISGIIRVFWVTTGWVEQGQTWVPILFRVGIFHSKIYTSTLQFTLILLSKE